MRLAPKDWLEMRPDRSFRLTRRFIPFWNISIRGSVQCSISTKSNIPFRHGENYYSHRQWHSFPIELENISFNDLNILASNDFDKYRIQRLDVSFEDAQIVELDSKKLHVEKATIDAEKGFENAWILMLKPLLENQCLEKAKETFPKFENLKVDSLHLNIESKRERLLYYPIYVLEYDYRSTKNFSCFVDGVTGFISGDRQFSFSKVTLATFIGFYPSIKVALFAFGSMVDLLLAFEIADDFTFSAALPLSLIVAPCVGFYARSYPKSYRNGLSEEQWQRDRSNAKKFTYGISKVN